MKTVPTTSRAGVVWLAVALAMLEAAAYVLVASRFLAAGSLQLEQDGAMLLYVAAACYLIGGVLILLRRRWMWAVGAGINALVVLLFFHLYQERLSVILSPAALATKGLQYLLEVVLLYLLVAEWLPWRQPPARPERNTRAMEA